MGGARKFRVLQGSFGCFKEVSGRINGCFKGVHESSVQNFRSVDALAEANFLCVS